jgi:mRNA-degrading endonuclease toxin of MazEF toxin-antitoxin module
MNVGEVWEVDFPFEDDPNQSKRRPCLIMNVDVIEALSIKVTTHESRDDYDIPIFKWKDANLLEPSYARVSKIMVFPKSAFIRKFGEINNSDFKNILKAFEEYHYK